MNIPSAAEACDRRRNGTARIRASSHRRQNPRSRIPTLCSLWRDWDAKVQTHRGVLSGRRIQTTASHAHAGQARAGKTDGAVPEKARAEPSCGASKAQAERREPGQIQIDFSRSGEISSGMDFKRVETCRALFVVKNQAGPVPPSQKWAILQFASTIPHLMQSGKKSPCPRRFSLALANVSLPSLLRADA